MDRERTRKNPAEQMTRTDEELFKDAAGRDPSAFNTLAERYWPRLVRFAEVYGGKGIDPEAAVQETLIRAWRARGKVKAQTNFSSWIFAIARNEVRRAASKRGTLPLEAAENAPAPGDGEPERAALQKERVMQFRKALDAIPEGQREAIVLTKFGGLSCKEAAETLKITDRAVRSAIYKGMKALELSLSEGK